MILDELRSHELRKPAEEAHQVLHALYDEAASVALEWRTFYRIPPTDQRYLDMTVDDIARDVLAMRYRELRIMYAQNPGAEAQHDDVQRRQLAALEEELAADTSWGDMVRAAAAVSRRETDPLAPSVRLASRSAPDPGMLDTLDDEPDDEEGAT